jgi:hypothetical protein
VDGNPLVGARGRLCRKGRRRRRPDGAVWNHINRYGFAPDSGLFREARGGSLPVITYTRAQRAARRIALSPGGSPWHASTPSVQPDRALDLPSPCPEWGSPALKIPPQADGDRPRNAASTGRRTTAGETRAKIRVVRPAENRTVSALACPYSVADLGRPSRGYADCRRSVRHHVRRTSGLDHLV